MASILVVDDEVEVGEAIRRVLTRPGSRSPSSPTPTRDCGPSMSSPPDIVVTDVIMPKIHGLELVKILRRRYPRIRVIAISGGGSFGAQSYKPDAISTHAYLAAAREAGAQEILTKPFDVSELLAAVRRQLPN